MDIAYGFKRKERDFAKTGIDGPFVFIDTPKSDRSERANMFQYIDACPDPVRLFMISNGGDLGHGKELSRLRKRLESMDVTIEYLGKDGLKKRERGRPNGSGWGPTPEHDEKIKAAWHDEDRTVRGVMNIAARLGYTVTQSQLKYRYKSRFD